MNRGPGLGPLGQRNANTPYSGQNNLPGNYGKYPGFNNHPGNNFGGFNAGNYNARGSLDQSGVGQFSPQNQNQGKENLSGSIRGSGVLGNSNSNLAVKEPVGFSRGNSPTKIPERENGMNSYGIAPQQNQNTAGFNLKGGNAGSFGNPQYPQNTQNPRSVSPNNRGFGLSPRGGDFNRGPYGNPDDPTFGNRGMYRNNQNPGGLYSGAYNPNNTDRGHNSMKNYGNRLNSQNSINGNNTIYSPQQQADKQGGYPGAFGHNRFNNNTSTSPNVVNNRQLGNTYGSQSNIAASGQYNGINGQSNAPGLDAGTRNRRFSNFDGERKFGGRNEQVPGYQHPNQRFTRNTISNSEQKQNGLYGRPSNFPTAGSLNNTLTNNTAPNTANKSDSKVQNSYSPFQVNNTTPISPSKDFNNGNQRENQNQLTSRFPGVPIKTGPTGMIDYSNRYPHLKSAGDLNPQEHGRLSLDKKHSPSNPELTSSTLVQPYQAAKISAINQTSPSLLSKNNIPNQNQNSVYEQRTMARTPTGDIPIRDHKPEVTPFVSSDKNNSTWQTGAQRYQTAGTVQNKQEDNQLSQNVQKYGSNVVHKLGIPTTIRADAVVSNVRELSQYNAPVAQNESVNNIVASSPSKAQVRKVTNYSRAKDFTSRDAQNLKEAGLNPLALTNYDANSSSFLEKLVSQDYAGNGQAWKGYLRNLKKEIHLVDSILATGGSGQGETINFTKELGSNFFLKSSELS